MDEIEQHEIPFEGKRHRNPKLRRGNFSSPGMFTVRKSLLRILCGGGRADGHWRI